MATRKNRSHRRRSHHGRKYRGGNGTQGAPAPSSYSSAATYQEAVNGGMNAQYGRVFNQSGNASQSNAIVGIQGQRAGSRKHRKHGKRGGFWGSVVNQAVVPFALLGMQQSYRRKGSSKNYTRRN
jgi:hypothetical protein